MALYTSLHVHLCYKGKEPPGGLALLGNKAKSLYLEIKDLKKKIKNEKDEKKMKDL